MVFLRGSSYRLRIPIFSAAIIAAMVYGGDRKIDANANIAIARVGDYYIHAASVGPHAERNNIRTLIGLVLKPVLTEYAEKRGIRVFDRDIEGLRTAFPGGSDSVYVRQIVSWRINKALHDEFGGGIIFQQFGIEPVEAYLKLLREAESAQQIAIIDSDYSDLFGMYWLKMFVDPGSRIISGILTDHSGR